MLKFSGWSCLNSGRNGESQRESSLLRVLVKDEQLQVHRPLDGMYPVGEPTNPAALHGSWLAVSVLQQTRCQPAGLPGPLLPFEGRGERGQPTLRQTCPWPKPRAQYAFKDSMIHGILQFTLSIAFRCVLHRCGSQDIRC